MMKVCFIVNELNFFLSHRLDLALELKKYHEIELITDTKNCAQGLIDELELQGIKIIHLNQRSGKCSIVGFVKYLSRLKKILLFRKPDSILLVTIELSFIGSLIAQFRTIGKLIFVISGLGEFRKPQRLREKIIWKIFKFSTLLLNFQKKDHKFIFQNNDDKTRFLISNISNEKNSYVIHGNGIRLDRFKRGLTDNKIKPSFLFAARLLVSKGIIEYFKTSIKLKKKYPELNFSIAGSYNPKNNDSISKKIMDLIKNSKEINFLGEIKHDSMHKIYASHSIFVLPSYGEGLPRSAIEAACMNMPLVMTDVAGCKECIEDKKNGFLISLKDNVSLFQAMEKFILNPDLICAMGKKSNEIAKNKFSIEKIANDYRKII